MLRLTYGELVWLIAILWIVACDHGDWANMILTKDETLNLVDKLQAEKIILEPKD